MHEPQMTRQRMTTLASILVLVAFYFASGKFGLSLAFINASASPVWPPSGIALAALLLFGRRLWPGVFVGAFLVNVTTPDPASISVGLQTAKSLLIATGNTFEALAG